MQYDPIKRSLGNVFNRTPFLRILFYRLLDLLVASFLAYRRELRNIEAGWFQSRTYCRCRFGIWAICTITFPINIPAARITGLDIKQEQVDDCNSFFTSIGRQQQVTFEYADLTKLDTRRNLI